MPGKVLPCSEKDYNFVTFAENKEHEVPFEIHMYRQLESALWWMWKRSAEWLPGPGSKCLSLFCTFLLIFFLFVLITSYYIFHLFFFAFILKISGPTAIISVNEKSCYLEHGMLRSSRRHYGSLDLRVFLCVQLTPLTQEWARWPPGVLSNSKSLHVFLDSWPLEIILKVSINKVETSYVFKASERLRGNNNPLLTDSETARTVGTVHDNKSKLHLSQVHFPSSNFLNCNKNWKRCELEFVNKIRDSWIKWVICLLFWPKGDFPWNPAEHRRN